MSITGIWLYSRLTKLFIESKNAQIGVRTRKIWSSKVGVHQEPHYCANPRNSVPEGCRSILETLIVRTPFQSDPIVGFELDSEALAEFIYQTYFI